VRVATVPSPHTSTLGATRGSSIRRNFLQVKGKRGFIFEAKRKMAPGGVDVPQSTPALCAFCSRNAVKKCVQCATCEKWYHFSCATRVTGRDSCDIEGDINFTCCEGDGEVTPREANADHGQLFTGLHAQTDSVDSEDIENDTPCHLPASPCILPSIKWICELINRHYYFTCILNNSSQGIIWVICSTGLNLEVSCLMASVLFLFI